MNESGAATTQAQAEGAGEMTIDQAAARLAAVGPEPAAADAQGEPAGDTQPADGETEQPANADPGPDGQPEAETAETPAEAGTEKPAEEKPEDAGADKGEHGWRHRVDKLTARAKNAETENATLKAELAELKAKVATAPDPDVLLKAGLPAGYVTADEAKVVSRDAELTGALAWLRENRAEFNRVQLERKPDLTTEDLADMYLSRREAFLEERLSVASAAQQIRQRVAKDMQADLEAGRALRSAALAQEAAKPQQAQRPAAAATVAAVKARLRPAPTNVLPSNSGSVAASVMRQNQKGVTKDQFRARAEEVGDFAAAEEAIAMMV